MRKARPGLVTETRLLREGVAALRAGDPARALTLFDTHAGPASPLGVRLRKRLKGLDVPLR